MKAVKTIALPVWIDTPELRAVMKALGAEALLVGGCVRNAVLGREATDIDIATKHRPDDVVQKLESAGIKAIPTGIEHGTITAVENGTPFEITTLRKDVETDGRRATVAFADSWDEDAQRRDFTMNTLLMDLSGQLYDPTGQGLSDLEARRVIFVGEPGQRIAEDYLRILRFFRFHAWFGNGDMDEQALVACGKAVDKIGDLSKERISQEVLKLLGSRQPVHVLKIMFENRILSQLFHVKHDLEILSRYYDHGSADPIASLAILSAFDSKHLATLETRMVFSNAQKRKYNDILEGLDSLTDISEQQIKILIYKYKNELSTIVSKVFSAKTGKELPAGIQDLLKNWEAPKMPVSGEDLIRAGYETGPELGDKLKELEDEWIKSGFTAISLPEA